MHGVVRGALLALLASTLTSCATLSSTGEAELAANADGTTAGFDTEARAATRRSEPYDGAVRLADLRATLLTPRVRKAFVDARERFHGAFATSFAREVVAMGNADEGVDAATLSGPPGDGEVLVFVAMYASDQKNRDLAVSGSTWDVRLMRGTTAVKPLAIERVRRSPAVTAVFPWVDRFDDLYLVRFPIVDASTSTTVLAPGELRLDVSSAQASCAVSWDLHD
jgi:hypothetical protein